MKVQGAEKRGFGFPNCMRFREQIGTQFLGWNVRLEAIGKLHRCCYALLDVLKNEPEPNAKSVAERIRQMSHPMRPKPEHVEGGHSSYAIMVQDLVAPQHPSTGWAKVSRYAT